MHAYQLLPPNRSSITLTHFIGNKKAAFDFPVEIKSTRRMRTHELVLLFHRTLKPSVQRSNRSLLSGTTSNSILQLCSCHVPSGLVCVMGCASGLVWAWVMQNTHQCIFQHTYMYPRLAETGLALKYGYTKNRNTSEAHLALVEKKKKTPNTVGIPYAKALAQKY